MKSEMEKGTSSSILGSSTGKCSWQLGMYHHERRGKTFLKRVQGAYLAVSIYLINCKERWLHMHGHLSTGIGHPHSWDCPGSQWSDIYGTYNRFAWNICSEKIQILLSIPDFLKRNIMWVGLLCNDFLLLFTFFLGLLYGGNRCWVNATYDAM